MIFSNPEYFELSEEEKVSQHNKLEELRDVHYQQLHESGAAERIIASPSLTNIHNSRLSLTEGTILYPFRNPLWNKPLMQGYSLYEDAGIYRPLSLFHDPLSSYFGDRNQENYAVYMGRYEPHDGGYITFGYAAGIILDQATATVIEREKYIPFVGIEKEDIKLIERQLAEVAAFAVANTLKIIDPLTVSEGHGQIIGYEDSDYPEC